MEAAPNSALRRAIIKSPDPARPSNYFRWLDDIAPCDVVIFARESSRQQHARGNLDCQIARLRRELRSRGFKVIAMFDEIGSGWRTERPKLQSAIEFARQENAIVVAEASNRFVRPRYYHPRAFPNAPFLDAELQRIARMAQGVTLATFLNPDATEREVRGYQTKRGISERARAKRPAGYKKARRERYLRQALILQELGASVRGIAKALKLKPSTVGDWLHPKTGQSGIDQIK